MSNILKIEGKKSVIVNRDLNAQIGVFLSASYLDKCYRLKFINAVDTDDKIAWAALRFDPEDRKFVKGGLNYIILVTTFGGNYKATGITELSTIKGCPRFYQLGNDLEIIVSETAKEAIESIKNCRREFEHAKRERDIPSDCFGFSSN